MGDWFDMIPDGGLKPFPEKVSIALLSDNGVSRVYRADDGYIYKRSIPFLIENELAFYQRLITTNYVPPCMRYDKYTLMILDLGKSEPINKFMDFVDSCALFLELLESEGIRHGDLTRPHVFCKNDEVRIIDWAESRWKDDPAPDKRPEGDRHWLLKTVAEMSDEAREGDDK